MAARLCPQDTGSTLLSHLVFLAGHGRPMLPFPPGEPLVGPGGLGTADQAFLPFIWPS